MNIFSYESKFSQTLMFVADLCLLNLSFVLCCLPLFTIGAAQAALYSGIRVLLDPEDDSSPAKAFWKAIRTGFGSVTLAWGAYALAELAVLAVLYFVVGYGLILGGAAVPIWMCVIALAILILLQSQIPLFHARFTCTAGQLLNNGARLVLAFPLRSLLLAVLLWLPVILFFVIHTLYFAMISLTFLLLYYALVYLLIFYVMKKPFNMLIDHYNATHDKDGNILPMTLDEEGNVVPAIINEDGTLSPAPQPEEETDNEDLTMDN